MRDVIAISTTGLLTNANRFEADAEKIVKATSPDPGISSSGEEAMVSQIEDAAAYKANATILKAADTMLGTVINVKS